jgi:prevent-host-death family protein
MFPEHLVPDASVRGSPEEPRVPVDARVEIGYGDASEEVGLVVAVLLPWSEMPTIPQKELRNNVGAVLRRAEAGEEFTITVAGRAVATLGPAQKRRWVSGPELKNVFATPAPESLVEDLEKFPVGLTDPFE